MKRILILPDTHAPYHDQRAWSVVMKVAKAFKWDTCLLLGDFFDFYAVSAHPKDPERESDLEVELAQGRVLVEELNAIPFQRRVVTLGNHEDRMSRYLMDKAPALWKTFLKKDLMGFKAGRWQIVPYRGDTRLGKLYATHEVGSNGAARVLDTYQGNVVTGHDHAMNYVVRGNARGETHVSATFGWLGDIDRVDYMHRIKVRRNWVLGFGVGYLRPNGYIHLQPVPLVDYSCVVEGRLFQ